MRLSIRRTAAVLGLSSIALSGGYLATAPQSHADERNGICSEGEFCYYFNSNQQGSVSDFKEDLGNYGNSQPDCYEFKGDGNGQGVCVKNNAASVWNRTDKPVSIYFNSNFGGQQQTVAPGEQINLAHGLKNNNASHRFAQDDPAPAPDPAQASAVDGPISRAEVLARGNDWVKQGVPYSMTGQHSDRGGRSYRTDCSGFVSMALHTSQSYNTIGMTSVVRPIDWSDLKPGDVVGTLGHGTGGAGGHVVIFTGWANDGHTEFNTIEERGGDGAVAYHRSVHMKVGGNPMLPYTYKNVVD